MVKGIALLCLGAVMLIVAVASLAADSVFRNGVCFFSGVAFLAFLFNTAWGYWCLFMADN